MKLSECLNDSCKVGHAGVTPTEVVAQRDIVDYPSEDNLPVESNTPNIRHSGNHQTVLSGSIKESCSICKYRTTENMDKCKGCLTVATVENRQADNRPEISQESIQNEQVKDSTIQPILEWKQNGTNLTGLV